MTKLLFSSWLSYPHSITYVALEYLNILNSSPSIETYLSPRAKLFQNWSQQPSIKKDPYYSEAFSISKYASHADIYDISIDLCVPPIIPPFVAKTKKSFFISEYGELSNKYINLCGGESYFDSLIKSNQKIFTASDWSKNIFSNFGYPSNLIDVVPHGAIKYTGNNELKSKLRTKIRRNLNIPDDSFFILNIGLPTFNKGIELLLKAITNSSCHNQIFLVLKGNDDLYNSSSQITKLLECLNADEKDRLKFKIIGSNLSRIEILSLLISCDLYASPFRAEGFNLPVADAFRNSVPILTTNCPPVNEYVINSQNVYFVDCDPVYSKKGLIDYHEPRLNSIIDCIEAAFTDWLDASAQNDIFSTRIYNDTSNQLSWKESLKLLLTST